MQVVSAALDPLGRPPHVSLVEPSLDAVSLRSDVICSTKIFTRRDGYDRASSLVVLSGYEPADL